MGWTREGSEVGQPWVGQPRSFKTLIHVRVPERAVGLETAIQSGGGGYQPVPRIIVCKPALRKGMVPFGPVEAGTKATWTVLRPRSWAEGEARHPRQP